ncbi:MAG: NADH-quinone oxidoreductase subunit A [Candidatus Zixiibacteriota bacterium]|nr:MAG: NADH-quinone oxidoreductase subunit A [candidate division Zixibacteria bacterium]
MFETFFPILLLLILAVILAIAFAAISILLGRKTRIGKKGDPYECGVEATGSTKDPVPVKFYLVAISFILFDIEVIFLYPWAVVSRDLGMYGFVAISIFVGVILVGYLYELGRGAFKWD